MIRLLLFSCVMLCLAALWIGLFETERVEVAAPLRDASAIALAVIGDSDSHSYQDSYSFPVSGDARGGAHKRSSLQWTEALNRLRGSQLDLGEWGVYGYRRLLLRAGRVVGLSLRAPRKEDFRYNFASSGNGCNDLLGGTSQVLRLVELMDGDPVRWRTGVVVIRIGINTFGDADELDALAQNARAPATQARINGCIDSIQRSLALLHSRHPGLRIVLVGIFNDAHWAPYLDRWQSPIALSNIDAGLDVFDDALRRMARSDPRIAFFDDRAWFAEHWGGRDERGMPAYRDLMIGSMRVGNTVGDEPNNAVLADGHAGTAWNACWAQSMVTLLNSRFGLGLAPITDAEVATLVEAGLPGHGGQRPGPAAIPSPADQKLDRPVASVNR